MTLLLVAVGAAVGAPTRFLLDRWISERHESALPWGTFAVNAIGCFVLGGLVGAAVQGHAYAFAGSGFCGGLTTFSTFAYETDQLALSGARRYGLLNIALSLTAGLVLAALGFALGKGF